MKKLFLILMVAMFAMTAQAQSFNGDVLQLYADTTTLMGGDVLVRHIYGYEPVKNPELQIVTFDYARVYYLNGGLLLFKEQQHQGGYDNTITIGQNTYTFLQLHDLIKTIDQANWQTGSWNVFLQFVN